MSAESASTLPAGFIIEHPTRGVMFEQDAAAHYDREQAYKSRWSPTKSRTEAQLFTSLDAARLALSRIEPDKVRREAQIRRYGSWAVVT